jgi:hypothetical protein
MGTLAIAAHFDGQRIVLDEPCELPKNASLLVTVLPSAEDGESDEVWLKAAVSSASFDFLSDQREDIYSLADGEPFDHRD